MRAILAITRNDLLVYFQERSNLIFLIVMPIIFVVVIGSVFTAGSDNTIVRMDVLDNDNSPASAALVEALADANPQVIVCPAAIGSNVEGDAPCALDEGVSIDSTLADERLQNGTVFATLTIPNGYEDTLFASEEVTLTFRADPSLSAPGIALNTVLSVITRVGGSIVAANLSTEAAAELDLVSDDNRDEFYAARYAEAEAAWGPPPPITVTTEVANVTVEEDTQGGFSGGFNQSATGMAAMYAMINVVGLAATLVQERLDGTLPRLLVMPITRGQILAGKFLRGYGLGLLQFAILLGFGAFMGVNFGQNIPAVLLISLVYVLTVSAMAIFMATVARTPEQASGFALLASMTLAPLGGAWWPLEIVPEFMRTVGHISPIAWCMDAFNTVLYDGGGIPEVIVPVLVLLGFALVFFVIGIRRFRYE